MRMKFFLTFILFCISFSSIKAKSNLTLDTFFNYTLLSSLSLSPDGQHLLVQTQRPAWESNSFENSLWLFQISERRQKLLTDQLLGNVNLQWSPSGNWVVFLMNNNSALKHVSASEQYIYLYSIKSDQVTSIPIGPDLPLAMTWSQNDSFLYFATFNSNSTIDKSEWKDIIPYRQTPTCSIQRVALDSQNGISFITTHIVDVPFLIGELLYSPNQEKLIFTSVSLNFENLDIFQIYSINLQNVSELNKLTTDHSLKQNLQLAADKKRILFQTDPIYSSEETLNLTQQRLYSVDLTNGLVERWVNDFEGAVFSYTTKSDGGVYILGQLGINVQIYSQVSPTSPSILHTGLNGTYSSISSSSLTHSVAFVFSSFSQAQEAYFISNIDQLISPTMITNENSEYNEIDLPKAEAYHWTNEDDNRTIEGILHYPPGKFQEKNLRLLVLIHGGPTSASVNSFIGGWYYWAAMAAAEGWLVLEPNYRGSTGYGDAFSNEIRYQPVTRPGRDILSGVDRLIQDGIADQTKLTIGGYSYGGFLTNWLITQTTRFNAALSGAGAVDQASFWGTTDFPVFMDYYLGGFPWVTGKMYHRESAIYHFGQIRTPTHIVVGGDDVRVPISQSMMLERALRYLGIPVNLLLLPNEGHPLSNNPWHGKIKVREELKWLQMYGNRSNTMKNEENI